ncbi:MAG TPA: mechanosensitive ion channel family protein [Opitutaceae bacterium]|nr:mechanosensitive ion channel family protein [Opitutaceae bacterium]
MTKTAARLLLMVSLLFGAAALPAQTATATVTQSSAADHIDAQTRVDQEHANITAAAAAVATGNAKKRTPNFMEHLVDSILALFNVKTSGNTTTHYVVSALFLLGALVLRRILTGVIFAQLRRFASRTKSTLDDHLLPALEGPVAMFVLVTGIFCALTVLKVSDATDEYISKASTIAFSLVIFWGLFRAFTATLDHAHQVAIDRDLGIAAFMPLIKKTLIAVFFAFGVLMVAQSVGIEVKPFLAGLGIGGLAFALAAQDTLANLFGSFVVAIDQPFRIGDVIRISGNEGVVEDIGLRSTKIRTGAKTLIILPNKSVASEAITNLSRIHKRRVDQTVGLSYETKPDQMENILNDFRKILEDDRGVDRELIAVYFSNFGESTLDVQIAYYAADPDWKKHMELRESLNLKFMRAVAARGLSMAFPTRTIQFEGDIARKMAGLPRN